MISRLFAAESRSFAAPENLGTEAFLTEHTGPGEMTLFLWQNERTVVIGRNQNAWKECRLDALNRDGGTLVRRLSGGGAVFHDLGNLNVSFCVPRAEEDIPGQTQIILNALQKLGVRASRSGRNDLEIDGRKFSGHAVYRQGASSCHHATLMLNVDRESLEKYLCVSPLKLQSRGVDSVRARVVNLSERFPSLTIPALCTALKDAFSEAYGLPAEPYPWQERLAGSGSDRLRSLQDRFSSWEWTFGRPIPFGIEDQARFAWGEVQLRLRLEHGCIQECKCWTDAMDPLWAEETETALQGIRFTPDAIRSALASVSFSSEPRVREDLENLLQRMTNR